MQREMPGPSWVLLSGRGSVLGRCPFSCPNALLVGSLCTQSCGKSLLGATTKAKRETTYQSNSYQNVRSFRERSLTWLKEVSDIF